METTISNYEFSESINAKYDGQLHIPAAVDIDLYNASGHKLRFPPSKKAQFVTVKGIAIIYQPRSNASEGARRDQSSDPVRINANLNDWSAMVEPSNV